MTLDHAIEAFEHNPNKVTAKKLIAVASEYARDGMISDAELEALKWQAESIAN